MILLNVLSAEGGPQAPQQARIRRYTPPVRLIVALLIVFVIWPASAAPPDDIERLAQDAYVFGYPLVVMGILEEAWLTHHGLNQSIFASFRITRSARAPSRTRTHCTPCPGWT